MLSIIIPTLNEEKYLPNLIKEIKKQKNFWDYEIIVADAGSQDKTIEIAKSFGCKVTKGGLPARGRNNGAKVAKGNIFLFLDADNIFLPSNFLERLLKEFKRRNLDIASFTIYINGSKLDRVLCWFYNFWTNLTQNFLPHAFNSILVKKEIHEKIGGFDEEIKLAEDHSYARKASKFGKFGFITTEPVLNSARRLEREGRVRTYLKYFLAGIYLFFIGDIKSDIFKYRFDYSLKKKKKRDKIKHI